MSRLVKGAPSPQKEQPDQKKVSKETVIFANVPTYER